MGFGNPRNRDSCWNWRNLLLGQGRGIIQARKNVRPREGRVGGKQLLDAVPMREHPHDLMNRNAGARHTGLPVANSGINGDVVVHTNNMPEKPCDSRPSSVSFDLSKTAMPSRLRRRLARGRWGKGPARASRPCRRQGRFSWRAIWGWARFRSCRLANRRPG